MIYIYIYIYAFNRRFYPKQLTLHSGYTFLSVCVTHPRCTVYDFFNYIYKKMSWLFQVYNDSE